MKSEKKIQLRSEEVQELMEDIPPLIVRFGISTILLILVFFSTIGYFIKYPEYWETEVYIYPQNARCEIKSDTNGIIKYIINDAKKHVLKNETLAILNIRGNDTILKATNTGIAYKCDFFYPNQKITKNDILFIISQSNSTKLRGVAYVPLNVIENITINQNIEVKTFDNQNLSGRINKKSFILNPKNRLYPIEIIFNNAKTQYPILYPIKGISFIECSNKTLFEHSMKKYAPYN